MRTLRLRKVVGLLVLLAMVPLTGLPAIHPDRVTAGGSGSEVRCPKRIGGLKNVPSDVGVGKTSLSCFYSTRGGSAVRVAVDWRPDTPETRGRCGSRDPQPVDMTAGGPEEFNRRLRSAERNVFGTYYVTEGRRVTRDQAEAALLSMMAAAAPRAHPCVPDEEPPSAEPLACPLVIGGTFVRADWYGDPPPAVAPRGDPAERQYEFECSYVNAYQDDGSSASLRVEWLERGPDDPTAALYCRAERRDSGSFVTIISDTSYVKARATNDIFAAGGEAILDALMAAASARTPPCPGAPAITGPPSAGGTPGVPSASRRQTTFILSGDAGDPRPAAGDRIELAEDDQYELVVGGPGGEVIREGFIGTGGVIAGIGAVVTAEDGSWAILVTVDVDATDGPGASVGPRSDASTPPDPDAAPGPSATTGAALPTPVHTEPPADAEAPATVPPSATAAPATVPPSATPAAAATDPPSATAPAKLDPADAEAVRTIAGHIEALGRTVEASGRGTVRIPAADIGALVALAPDLAVEVRTGAGSITVTTELGDILITPDIGPDGLVELRLSRFAWVTSLPIVQQLVRTLNAGVSERGARFRTISVTPEGIELQAVGHTPGS